MLKQLDITGQIWAASEPVANRVVIAFQNSTNTINGVDVGHVALIDLSTGQPVPAFSPFFDDRIHGFEIIEDQILIFGSFRSLTYLGVTTTRMQGMVLFDPVTLTFRPIIDYFRASKGRNHIRKAQYYAPTNTVYFCGLFLATTIDAFNKPVGENSQLTGVGEMQYDGTNLRFLPTVLPDWDNRDPIDQINVVSIALDKINGVLYTTIRPNDVNTGPTPGSATFDISTPGAFVRRPWNLGDKGANSAINIFYNDGHVYLSYHNTTILGSTRGFFAELTTCANGDCSPTVTSMDLFFKSVNGAPTVSDMFFDGDNIFIAGYFRTILLDGVNTNGTVDASPVGIRRFAAYSGFLCYNKGANKITSDFLEMIDNADGPPNLAWVSSIIEHDNRIHVFGFFQNVDYSKKIGQIIFNKNNGTKAVLAHVPLILP